MSQISKILFLVSDFEPHYISHRPHCFLDIGIAMSISINYYWGDKKPHHYERRHEGQSECIYIDISCIWQLLSSTHTSITFHFFTETILFSVGCLLANISYASYHPHKTNHSGKTSCAKQDLVTMKSIQVDKYNKMTKPWMKNSPDNSPHNMNCRPNSGRWIVGSTSFILNYSLK